MAAQGRVNSGNRSGAKWLRTICSVYDTTRERSVMHGMKTITTILTATGLLLTAHPVMAARVARTSDIAYVRGGDIYVGKGSAEKRLTTGGGHSRPRWSPDGRRIAYLTGAQLWTMNADGT